MNSLISFGIPVYNGEQKIGECLSRLILIAQPIDALIIVSDNCSTDNTLQIIRLFANKYKNIRILSSKQNLGFDRNCLRLFEEAQTDYFWIIGDDDYIDETQFSIVYRRLKQSTFDLFVVNAGDRVTREVPSSFYSGHKLCQYLGAHITFISSLIFSVKDIRLIPIENFCGTEFIHVNVALTVAGKSDAFIGWDQENTIFSTLTNNCTYSKRFLELFGCKMKQVASLSVGFYSKKELRTFVRSHCPILFKKKIRGIFSLRLLGIINFCFLFAHQNEIRYSFGPFISFLMFQSCLFSPSFLKLFSHSSKKLR